LTYLLIIYFSIILFVGFKSKGYKDRQDYLYAGRKLTAIPLLMTLVTTWYGAISGVGQEIAYNGVSAWLYLGLSYYVAAYIYSEFISHKIIDFNISSILIGILEHMGKKSAMIAAPIVLLYISPAPYLIMLGNIIDTMIFQSKNFELSIIIGIIVSTIYCFKGGFKSIISTDRLQFHFMFSGFLLLSLYIVFIYDFGFIKLNNIYLKNPQLFGIPGQEGWGYIIAWGFLAMLTFIDPSFHQRTFAANNKEEIKKAIKLSILFWLAFDMMTLFCGLYAINLSSNTPYISLADLVFQNSPILYGIFVISILSVLMSTIDSFTFISAITIGKDIRQIFNKDYKKIHINWGIFFSIAISVLIILLFDNSRILNIWLTFGAYMASGLLIPFICIINMRKIKKPTLFILAPILLTLIWDFFPFYDILPMYPGLLLSCILALKLTKTKNN
tara:strand:- start:3379 stop:4707 length:1329 start_codon:yes stop_codon:yes gene_type:complete